MARVANALNQASTTSMKSWVTSPTSIASNPAASIRSPIGRVLVTARGPILAARRCSDLDRSSDTTIVVKAVRPPGFKSRLQALSTESLGRSQQMTST